MISAKEAAKIALDYFFEINELVGLTKDKVTNLTIDEVELFENEEYGLKDWRITIGYEMPASITRQIVENTVTPRRYKQVALDVEGNVKTMKIRTPANE
jgi:hypothetical protein